MKRSASWLAALGSALCGVLFTAACESSDAAPENDGGSEPTQDAGTPPASDGGSDGAIPTANNCADLAALHAKGELEAGIAYAGANGFRFQLSRAEAAPSALAECTSLEEGVSKLTPSSPGATLSYRSPDFDLALSRGLADKVAGRPMDVRGLSRVASMGKTYVAAVAAIAVNEGKLDLDNRDGKHTLADYLPETVGHISGADKITVRQLLNHTSGIPDYWGEELGPAWFTLIFERHEQGLGVTEDDALALVDGQPLRFEPGTSAEYCNTAYILASRVLTKVFGQPYQDVLRTRLLAPLGLDHTYSEKHDAFDLTQVAHGYRDAAPLGQSFDDWFAIDQGYGFANGGIVTTADDARNWFHELIGARTTAPGVEAQKIAQIMRSPTDGYGIGLMTYKSCWTHGGELTGYEAFAFTCQNGVSMALLINSSEPAADEGLTAFSYGLMDKQSGN